MSPVHDAFGRTTEESSQSATAAQAPSDAAHPASVSRSERGGGGTGAARIVGRLLVVLLLLAGGAAAVAATMRHAIDIAPDQSRAVEHALAKDPLGPRSLLRAAPLRRGLDRLRRELDPGDRIVGVTVTPGRLLLSLADARDQSRWLMLGADGSIDEHDLSSTDDSAGVPFEAIRPAGATRFLARKLRELRPHARDPTLSLAILTSSSSTTGAFGQSASATRRTLRWSVRFAGVRAAEESWTLDSSGRQVR